MFAVNVETFAVPLRSSSPSTAKRKNGEFRSLYTARYEQNISCPYTYLCLSGNRYFAKM